MKNQEQKPSVSPAAKIAGIVAAVVAVVGIFMLITSKVQQADPTLTKAPPPGPDAQTLAPSAEKSKHPGPMYTMTPSGPVLNHAETSPPQQAGNTPSGLLVLSPASSH